MRRAPHTTYLTAALVHNSLGCLAVVLPSSPDQKAYLKARSTPEQFQLVHSPPAIPVSHISQPASFPSFSKTACTRHVCSSFPLSTSHRFCYVHKIYVEDHLLSPYSQAGDPLDADAVYDALRALRTAHSLPSESAVHVKGDSAALHDLFSPEKDMDDKVKVEADGWGAFVTWGVSSIVDYLSPV
ncbi:hypothetical protein C8Q80DRAFT_51848 [Daedaleopsis nitida]|nr:hypothetical protein C8Q80DRAFT_51848 [Daedaleopsis nitida]